MILGIFLVIIGIIFLLKNLGLIVLPTSFWQLIYPVILIVLGVYIAIAARKGKYYRDWLMRKGWKHRDENLPQ